MILSSDFEEKGSNVSDSVLRKIAEDEQKRQTRIIAQSLCGVLLIGAGDGAELVSHYNIHLRYEQYPPGVSMSEEPLVGKPITLHFMSRNWRDNLTEATAEAAVRVYTFEDGCIVKRPRNAKQMILEDKNGPSRNRPLRTLTLGWDTSLVSAWRLSHESGWGRGGSATPRWGSPYAAINSTR